MGHFALHENDVLHRNLFCKSNPEAKSRYRQKSFGCHAIGSVIQLHILEQEMTQVFKTCWLICTLCALSSAHVFAFCVVAPHWLEFHFSNPNQGAIREKSAWRARDGRERDSCKWIRAHIQQVLAAGDHMPWYLHGRQPIPRRNGV
jgi:hypothetical protein